MYSKKTYNNPHSRDRCTQRKTTRKKKNFSRLSTFFHGAYFDGKSHLLSTKIWRSSPKTCRIRTNKRGEIFECLCIQDNYTYGGQRRNIACFSRMWFHNLCVVFCARACRHFRTGWFICSREIHGWYRGSVREVRGGCVLVQTKFGIRPVQRECFSRLFRRSSR